MQLGRSLLVKTVTTALLVTAAGCGGGGGDADPATNGGGHAPPSPSSGPPPILPAVTDAWHVPSCTSVTGAPVSFTPDGGLHRASIEQPAVPNYVTYGVAALAAGSTLVAVVGSTTPLASAEIYFSTDAGCSWQASGQKFENVWYPSDVEIAEFGGTAYVWSDHGFLHVIEPTGIARPFKLDEFPYWVSGPHGLGVDPQNPARVRVAVYDCLHRASCGRGSDIYETTNEGTDWTRVGTQSAPYLATRVRFSPTNLNHAVAPYGLVGSEFDDAAGFVTFDGSNAWLSGQGLPTGWSTDEQAIGPDGQTVWLLAHTGDYPSNTLVSAIYVSYDGGLNYQEAFATSADNPFASGSPYGDPIPYARIFPHPSDADVVYLAYTSRAAGKSYLYRYDAELDELTKQEWPSSEGGVWSLAFNPSNPDHLYLGLAAAD